MAGDSLGSLVVKISGDMSELKTAMDRSVYVTEQAFSKIGSSIDKANASIISSVKGMAAGIVGALSFDAFVGMIRGAIDAADRLNDLSKSTGLTVTQLAGLKIAAKQSGSDLEGIAQSVNKLSVNIGNNTEKFAKLGITAKDPLQALAQFADIFKRLEDPQLRAAVGAEALGKNWATAAPLLAEGGDQIRAIATKAAAAGSGLDEFAKQADEFNDKMVLITGSTGLAGKAIAPLMPLLNQLADDLLAAKKASQGASDGFNPLLETFKAIIVLGGNVKFVFQGIGNDIGAMAAQLAALARGDFTAFVEIGKMATEDAAKARSEFDQWERQTMALGTALDYSKGKAADFDQVSRRLASSTAAAAREEEAAMAASNRALRERAQAFLNEKKNAEDVLAAYRGLLKGLQDKLLIDKELTESNKLQIALDALSAKSRAAITTAMEAYLKALAKKIDQQKQDKAGLEAYIKVEEDWLATQQEIDGVLAGIERKKADAILSTEKLIDQVKFEASIAGLSNEAREKEIALRQLVLDGIDKESDAYAQLAPRLTAAMDARSSAQALASTQQHLEQMEFEISLIGRSNVERERAIALRTLETSAIDKQSAEYANLATRIKEAVDTRELRTTLVSLRDSLSDTLVAAFEEDGVKGAAKAFIAWLEKQFAALVLKPLIAPVMGDVAGLVLGLFGLGASGAGGAAGSTAGGLGSLLSSASSIGSLGSNGSAALSWLQGGYSADAAAGLPAGTILGQGSTGSFFSAGGFGSVGTAGGLLGTAALGALGGSVISSSISKDEDASRNGAIAGAAGSVIGAYVATGTAIGGPWGAVIGAVIGGLIAAFSDADGPAMRAAQVVAGRSLDGYTYALESKLGTLGIAKGSDKWFSDSDMGKTLTDWFKTIENIDNAVADRLSEAQLAAAKIAVGGQDLKLGFGIEHQDVDPSAFGHIVQDRYARLFDSIDTAMGSLVRGFEGTTGDLLKLVDDLAAVNEQLTANGSELAKVFGQSINFADLQKFNQEGESYSQTLARLGQTYYATNAIAAMFGKTQEQVWGTVGLASEEARSKLVALSGGLDKFTAQLGSYYQHYFTAQERLTITSKQLGDVFQGLGYSMPTSLTGFRALVESLDLTTDGGRKAYAALMAIEGQFYDFVTATEKAGTAIKLLGGLMKEVGNAPDMPGGNSFGGIRVGGIGNFPFSPAPLTPGSITNDRGPAPIFTQPGLSRDDMAELGRAAQEAHLQIVALAESLANSFRDAYRSIELAGLTNEEQYRYLQREAATTLGNLAGATTGDEVQSIAERVRQDMLTAFSLLSPDEQGNRRQEFLSNLLKVQQLVDETLHRIDPLNDGVSPQQVQAEQQSQAASTQKLAAEMQKAAAAAMQEAATAILLASQAAPKVVALPGGGVRVEAGA